MWFLDVDLPQGVEEFLDLWIEFGIEAFETLDAKGLNRVLYSISALHVSVQDRRLANLLKDALRRKRASSDALWRLLGDVRAIGFEYDGSRWVIRTTC